MEKKIRISPAAEVPEKTYKCADDELEIFSFFIKLVQLKRVIDPHLK